MIRVEIKPLSVNEAWKGRRFKTDKYKSYERSLMFLLPTLALPAGPYEVKYEFGFSNLASDLDNPVKQLQDTLAKKYGFNDRDVFRIVVEKKIVKAGCEYMAFEINQL